MVSGLSLYLPFHAGPVWDLQPYSFRSALTAGIVLYNDPEHRDFAWPLARQAIAELKELRPFFQGDFYPLLPLTTSQADWYAYQLDRPDLGAGCVLVFRRPESAETAKEIVLQHIAPAATYAVSVSGETYAAGEHHTLSGAALARQRVPIAAAPGSALIRYQRQR